MFTTDGTIFGKRTTLVKCGLSKNFHNAVTASDKEENRANSFTQNYGNRLLDLSAALNEKELQLVELREQHISVVNRAAIARKNWEDAIKSKDHLIVDLQKALHAKKCELDRQERVNEENVQRLLQQREDEENAELTQKQRNISLLEQKNAHFVEELVEQQKTIAKLKRQVESRERHCASYLHKMEVVNVRVQDLKAALQNKEEVVENQKKYSQELKTLIWKRDGMIGQLQLAEQQLQSALAKQEAEHEALKCLKEKLQEEKSLAENNLVRVKEFYAHLDCEALHKECERGLHEKEAFLRKQWRQIVVLQKGLQSAEMALSSKQKDEHQLLEENRRVVGRYESLRHVFEQGQRKQQQLEMDLEAVLERLSTAELVIAEAEQSATVESTRYAMPSDGSITEEQAADSGVDDFDAEKESMASMRSTAKKMVSRAGTVPRGSKPNFSQTSVIVEGSPPLFSSARRLSRPWSTLQKSRNPVDAKTPHVNEECSKQMPSNSHRCELTQIVRNFYPYSTKPAQKAERKSRTIASPSQAHSNPYETNVCIDKRAEAKTNAKTEAKTSFSSPSSHRSSPCAEVDVDSCSEIGEMTVAEKSSTLLGPSQVASFSERKQNSPPSIYSTRKRRSSHLQRSPSPEYSRSQPFSPAGQKTNRSLAADVSKAEPYKNWISGDSEAFQPSQPAKPLSSTKEVKTVPKLKIPRSPEQSEISGSSSVEFDRSRHPLAKSEPQAAANELSRSLLGVSSKTFQTAVKIPRRGSEYHPVRRESFKPPTPVPIKMQGSADTALRSLQEEVMKRERGWRKTEANMRAALCQRLAALKDAEKISLEVMDSRRGETRQSAQERKTGGRC